MKQIELWMDQEKPDYLSHIMIHGRRTSNPRLCANMLHRPMREWIPAITTKHKVWRGLICELSGVLNSLHFSVRFVGIPEIYEEFLKMVNAQESYGIVIELEYAPYNNRVVEILSPGASNEASSLDQPQQHIEIPSTQDQVPEGTGLVCMLGRNGDARIADVISGVVADMQILSENATDRYLKKRLRVIERSLASGNIHIYLNVLYDAQDAAKRILHMGIPGLFLNAVQEEAMSMPAVLGSGTDLVQAVVRVCRLHSLPFEDVVVLVVQNSSETFDMIVRSLCKDSIGVHTFLLSGDGVRDAETLNSMSDTYVSFLRKSLAQFIRSYPKEEWIDAMATEAVLRRLCRERENGAE